MWASSKQLSSGVDSFYWQAHCLLCGTPTVRHPRNKVLEVRTFSKISKRKVECGKSSVDRRCAQGRLGAVGDLVAAEGRYHQSITTQDVGMYMHSGLPKGRPVNEKGQEAFIKS